MVDNQLPTAPTHAHLCNNWDYEARPRTLLEFRIKKTQKLGQSEDCQRNGQGKGAEAPKKSIEIWSVWRSSQYPSGVCEASLISRTGGAWRGEIAREIHHVGYGRELDAMEDHQHVLGYVGMSENRLYSICNFSKGAWLIKHAILRGPDDFWTHPNLWHLKIWCL